MKRIIYFVVFLIFPCLLDAQVADTSQSSRIIVELADNFRFVNDGNEGIKYLNGNVRMYQDSTFMYCDTAILKGNQLTAFGNVVIIQNDTINVFSDSLIYDGDLKLATLYDSVILQSKTRELYTDYLEYDLNTKIGKYVTGALLKNENTEIKSLRGDYYVNEERIKFFTNVTVVNEDFKLWADSLEYDSENDITYFLSPTRIDQDSSKIYCEAGFYDIENEVAEFRENAQYIQGKKTVKGEVITYDATKKLVVIAGSSVYKEEDKIAKADTIKYYEESEDTELIGSASYMDKDRSVSGESILYNAKSESFSSKGRSTVVDSSTFLTADFMDFSQEEDFGIARGKVELLDTSSQTTIFSEVMEYKQNENYSKAYNDDGNRPMMQTVMEEDSMFLKADTLFSFEMIDTIGLADTVSMDTLPKKTLLTAFHNVKIYKSNFQAQCDSMRFNTTDSILTMFANPIIWSDSSQFTADTVDIYLKNGQIDKVDLRNKAFIINTEDSIYFNQIKGKSIEVFFVDGAMDSMSVVGNAESVYFMLDEENAYIGMNKSICSKMSFTFEDNDLKDIFFYVNVNSNLIPMKDVDPADTLDGFNWQPKIRPKSKQEL